MRNKSYAFAAGLKMPSAADDNPWLATRRFAVMFAGLVDDATLDRIAKASASYARTSKRQASKYRPKDAPAKIRPNDLYVCAAMLASVANMGCRQLAPVFGRGSSWTQFAIASGLVLMSDRRAAIQAEAELMLTMSRSMPR